MSNSGGQGLQKRIQKAQRFLGSHAQVIFVHPAWGKTPPDALSSLTGEHACLIGRSEAAFKDAVRRALGIAG